MINPVLSSTLRVIKSARNVSINKEKIEKIAGEWAKIKITSPPWPRELRFETKDTRRLFDYLIVLDSLNFCFWSKDGSDKWRVVYKNEKYSGYFALAMALKRFFEEDPKRPTFEYLANISFSEFSKIFEGEGKLLLLKKRWEIIMAVSKVMVEKYGGNSERLVFSGSHKVSKFVPKIVRELPSFNDEAEYNGKKVYFWKRAQILASNIYGATDGCGVGYFEDLDYLTAFADYKLPQILNYWGILEYSPLLLKKIKGKILIKVGSQDEIEIRSATVWAVEYVKEALLKRGKRMKSFEIDLLLWNESKRIQINKPYHLTQTFFY